jgi:nucleotide-binding universal stress UspA family protein
MIISHSFKQKKKNMKTILVATDFSKAATNAANYAVDMALSIKAEVVLLHIYQLPANYSEISIPIDFENIVSSLKSDLQKLKHALSKRACGRVHILTEIKSGTFFHELNNACADYKPYCVVMGSQGTSAIDRFVFGGHTVYAMEHLEWPMITVPPAIGFTTIKKIGLACDLNEVEETVPIDEIKTLVNDFSAELHILNTGDEKTFDPDVVFEAGELQRLLGALKPTYHLLTNKDASEGILAFAEKNQIDLLIILPKRHGLFYRLLYKTNTKQFVLHSYVPVMAMHPHTI